MGKFKKIVAFVLGLTLLAGMSGCSKVEEKTAATGELKKITISEPVRGVLWGPVHLAKELGYFKEQGLEVEIVTVQGDAPTAPVLAGDAQFGLFGPEMILGLNEKGQGVKLLLTSTDKYPYSLVAGPDYKTVESLKGKVLNGADSGSSPRQFVRSALNTAGLDANKDATYVNVPNASVLAALESGEIQATYASPEVRSLALAAGNNLIVDMYDPEVHKKVLNSEAYEMYITFTTDEYIKENPETVQKYVNAIYKAILWADSHTAEEIAEAIRPSFKDNKNLDQAIKEIKDNGIYSSNGGFSEEGFAAINKMAVSAGITQKEVGYEDAVDDSFLKNAQKNINLK